MSRKKSKEISNISHPWSEGTKSGTGIRCPKCGNDGMDGSIHGRGGQWSVERICMKPGENGKPCRQKWSGGIGVQQADYSQPLPIEGVASSTDDHPINDDVGQPFRDPSKNTDPFEEE